MKKITIYIYYVVIIEQGINKKQGVTMDFDNYMKQYGESLGVEMFIADGLCSFSACGTDVYVEETEEKGVLAIHAEICGASENIEKSMYETFLEKNHLLHVANGATIARDPEDGSLILQSIISNYALDDNAFTAEMASFLNVLEELRGKRESSVTEVQENIPVFMMNMV